MYMLSTCSDRAWTGCSTLGADYCVIKADSSGDEARFD